MVFYSHSMEKYGTEIEAYERALIRKAFGASIFDPSTDLLEKDDDELAMKECIQTIGYSDIIVFSTTSGVVGRGVMEEVTKAQELNKELYVIDGGEIYRTPLVRFKVIGFTNRAYAIAQPLKTSQIV